VPGSEGRRKNIQWDILPNIGFDPEELALLEIMIYSSCVIFGSFIWCSKRGKNQKSDLEKEKSK
jgi:hypothetical protein